MSATRRRPFYTRGLITFLMVTGFAMVTVTGVVLYFAPAGRSRERSTGHEDARRQVGKGIDAALDEAEKRTGAGAVAEDGRATAFRSEAAEEHIEGSGYGGGGGFGRMTIRDVAARHGLDYEEVRSRLAAQNIVFEEHETLRAIADRQSVTPGELGRLASGQ